MKYLLLMIFFAYMLVTSLESMQEDIQELEKIKTEKSSQKISISQEKVLSL